jgi:hypothetical protein
MSKSPIFLSVFAALLLLFSLGVSAQGGYGASSVSVTQSSLSIPLRGSATLGYNVTLASGGTWGTNLEVVNQAQLAADGITVSLTTAQGDPPFSGELSILTSISTAPGNYTMTLAATGDDPSVSNVAVNFDVVAAGAPTTVRSGYGTPAGGAYYPAPSGNLALISGALVALIAAVAAYLLFVSRSAIARLVYGGVALILAGIVVWLYGDYAGGLMQYVAGGGAAIALGILVWLYGDLRARAFRQRGATVLIGIGAIMMVAGTGAWLYGDYNGGGALYVWSGVALLAAGTVVWFCGDSMIRAAKK